MTFYQDIIGVQLPRLFHVPPAEIGTAGDAAIKLAYVAGLDLDDWQQWVVRHVLGTKEETYWNPTLQKEMHMSSAYEIALIVARQNGKGSIMEALELAWLFLLGANTVCHSAHEFATSKEHFQRIEGLVSQTPELKGQLARGGIKWSHGDESITRSNGQRIVFKTRTKGAARGFTIDKLVMDEAMILKKEMVGAMLPATAAVPDAQIMCAGSAGDRESEYFGRARDRGINKTDPRLFLAEWSADIHTAMCEKDCTSHDERQSPSSWAKANPGLGIRLRVDNVTSELGAMDEDTFDRERLSVGDWPVTGEPWKVIAKNEWAARNGIVPGFSPHGPFVFSVDVTPDLKWASIVVAGSTPADTLMVEVTGDDGALHEKDRTDHRPGVKWIVPRLIELHKRHKGSHFVINKSLPASMFIDELTEAGLKLLHPTTREYQTACGDFYTGIVPRGEGVPHIWHCNQPDMNTAVANAEKRISADLWAWDTRTKTDDISPLIAATHAAWGHKMLLHKPKTKPGFAFV